LLIPVSTAWRNNLERFESANTTAAAIIDKIAVKIVLDPPVLMIGGAVLTDDAEDTTGGFDDELDETTTGVDDTDELIDETTELTELDDDTTGVDDTDELTELEYELLDT